MALRNDSVNFWFWGYRRDIGTELQAPVDKHIFMPTFKVSYDAKASYKEIWD